MPAVNPRVLDGLRSLDAASAPGMLQALIDQFLRETEPRLRMLQEFITANDVVGAERLIRGLKATCANIGAQAMSRMCADLQPPGRPFDGARATAMLASLETEYRSVKAELEAVRRSL
jgi:HPt (histidine-containing phosphotransfer) domain-containing protein